MSFEAAFWPGYWWVFIALALFVAWWLRRRADRRADRVRAEYRKYLAYRAGVDALARATDERKDWG